MTRLTMMSGMVVFALAMASTSPADDKTEAGPMKVVVHVNFPESGTQGAGLKNITNILKDAPDTVVEVVCHGGGHRPGGEGPDRPRRGGRGPDQEGGQVRRLREHDAAEVDQEGGPACRASASVPSGAIEVIRKQQKDGYAYFKP